MNKVKIYQQKNKKTKETKSAKNIIYDLYRKIKKSDCSKKLKK